MRATERETAAAHRLADALLEFLVAREDGCRQRDTAWRRQEAERAPQPVIPSRPIPGPRADKHEGQPEPLLLDSKDAARYLAIGVRSLWSMTAPRGPIPAVRIGVLVRYRVKDLDECADRLCTKTKS